MEADLRELARWPDVPAVCSSAGWTDQKHTLYLSLLQESFVNQLHDGEISFEGLYSRSRRRPSRPKQSSKVHRAESCRKVELEQVRPPCCELQEDGEVHSTDDEASGAESSGSQASATSPGQSSSTSRFGERKHSPCRTAEGSDQNFIDEDTEGSGESRRHRRNKRLKSADDTMDDQKNRTIPGTST